MKRNVVFGSIVAIAMSVGVAAQSGSSSPQTPPSSSSRSSQSVTVTGCLQSGSPSATGTSGTAAGGAAASAESFILANAKVGAGDKAAAGAPSSTATPPSSTAGTSGAASAGSASQYKLTGGSKDDLKKYANSQVEITGKLDSASSSGGAMGGASRSSDSGPTLHVDSVKQISPSCSAQ